MSLPQTTKKIFHNPNNGVRDINSALCYACYGFLHFTHGYDDIGNGIWSVLFVLYMVSLFLLLTFLAMLNEDTASKILLVCVIILLVLGVILLLLMFFNPNAVHNLYTYIAAS